MHIELPPSTPTQLAVLMHANAPCISLASRAGIMRQPCIATSAQTKNKTVDEQVPSRRPAPQDIHMPRALPQAAALRPCLQGRVRRDAVPAVHRERGQVPALRPCAEAALLESRGRHPERLQPQTGGHFASVWPQDDRDMPRGGSGAPINGPRASTSDHIARRNLATCHDADPSQAFMTLMLVGL